MQKINFDAPDMLTQKIDQAIKKWGFLSRAEFFRFAAIDFIRNDARLMPADETIRDHTKAIRSIKARQELAELKTLS